MIREGFSPPASLRHGLSAGEALPVSILERWRQATGLELYEAFGMSEISTYISSSPLIPVRPGSPGKPQPGRSVAILDGGRLGVHRSDPGLMLGYWNRPEDMVSAYDGDWFTGGDLGEFDEDGYFWFAGRADDLMNAGGYRVSPLEVENVFLQHPAVLDAGVREWRVSPDTTIVAAFVVPQNGVTADPVALKAFARERLAAYKCPREVFLVKALPRTANGKLKRNAMAP
jgi:acyl-coenzyme A synthetase/AMP-(fatty) acid ligase